MESGIRLGGGDEGSETPMHSIFTQLTIQAYLDGGWQDVARVHFHEPEKGHRGSTTTEYVLDYFVKHAAIDSVTDPVRDDRAVSILHPVGEDRWLPTWPAFLMDMLPQGPARILLGKALGLNGVLASSELSLLAYAGGCPVGNLRIREASENTVRAEAVRGIPINEVLTRSPAFIDYATSLPWSSPSSVCLQGEWPKIQLTLASDGLLYPDMAIDDSEAGQRYIVKLARSRDPRDSLILEIEGIYASALAEIGVPIPRGYMRGEGVIMIPRFDRVPADGRVRYGQESLVSAIGVSEFGHITSHEEYLATISSVSSDPRGDRLAYVQRDFLNLALGNDDNHGRNAALSKTRRDVRLSRVFDLAPMRIAGRGIARSTKWACLKERGNDYRPCWGTVARTVAEDPRERDDILDSLATLASSLPKVAQVVRRDCSDRDAADHAMGRLEHLVRDAETAPRLDW